MQLGAIGVPNLAAEDADDASCLRLIFLRFAASETGVSDTPGV